MLKALIQLFSESFLKSKSDWVGGQAFPSSRIVLSPETTSYIPPSDGYIGFVKRNGDSFAIEILGFNSADKIVSRFTFSYVSGGKEVYLSNVIPVKQGCTVTIDGGPSELWFSPSVGSKY